MAEKRTQLVTLGTLEQGLTRIKREYLAAIAGAGYASFRKAESVPGADEAKADVLYLVQTGYNLSSRNLIWDAGRIGLVVSHNSVNDGNHLPAGVAHGCHVGLPFIPFFLKIKL